jgi:hypothetical protein
VVRAGTYLPDDTNTIAVIRDEIEHLSEAQSLSLLRLTIVHVEKPFDLTLHAKIYQPVSKILNLMQNSQPHRLLHPTRDMQQRKFASDIHPTGSFQNIKCDKDFSQ